MTVLEYIYGRLSSYAPLTDVVGLRISPGISRQGESNPRVRYLAFGARPEQTHDGEQDLRDFVLQVDAIASDYDQARAVAAFCCDALRGSESPLAGVFIQIENDGMDIPEAENHEFRCMVEARVWHR